MRVPERSDVHHHPDPTDAWELVRVRTEVTIHLRDERLSDGLEIVEAFDACIDALRLAFAAWEIDGSLERAMRRWLHAWREAERADEERRNRQREERALASGRSVHCPDCAGVFRAGAGLATHRRHKHGVKR